MENLDYITQFLTQISYQDFNLVFFMALFTYFQYRYIQERALLYYIGYLVLIFLFTARSADLVENIVLAQGLEVVDFWRYTDLTLGAGFAAFHFLFIAEFVEMKKHLPKEYKILMAFLTAIGISILMDWVVLFYFKNLYWSKIMESVGQLFVTLIIPYVLFLLFKINTQYARILRKAYFILFVLTFIPMLFIYDSGGGVSYAPNLFKENITPTQVAVIIENIIFIWLFVFRSKESLLEKAQLQQELAITEERSEHLKNMLTLTSEMTTNISHEFRTPLTVIKGMAEELRDNQGAKKLILKNAEKLLSMVNQMLDLAKLESGNLKLKWTQGDIISFLHYQTESWATFAKQKNIRLNFYSSLDELVMDMEQERLGQVMSNLISNAIKFTPEYGKIIISVERKTTGILIKIKDSGMGIPSDDLVHIFDRFYRSRLIH